MCEFMRYLILLLVGLLQAQGATVVFSTLQLSGAVNNRPIEVRMDGDVVLAGTNFVYGRALVLQPVAGVVRTNLVAANYVVALDGRELKITVPAGTGTYDAAGLVTAGGCVSVGDAPWVSQVTSSNGSVVIWPSSGRGIVDLAAVGGGGGNGISGAVSNPFTMGAVSVSSSNGLADFSGFVSGMKARSFQGTNGTFYGDVYAPRVTGKLLAMSGGFVTVLSDPSGTVPLLAYEDVGGSLVFGGAGPVGSGQGLTNLTLPSSVTFSNVAYSVKSLPGNGVTIDMAGASLQQIVLTNNAVLGLANVAAGRNVGVQFWGTNNQFYIVMPTGVRLLSGSATNIVTTNKSCFISFTGFSPWATNVVAAVAIEP